jgi:ribosomal protein S18 acetylase RimI-like enzyme
VPNFSDEAMRPPDAGETGALAAMLTRSFADDALFAWWLRAPSRPAALRRYFDLVLQAHLDRSDTMLVSNRLDACAIWDEPGRAPRWPATIRALRLISLLRPGLHRYQPLRLGRLIRALDSLRPWDKPHWYLCYLGVEPTLQGTGRGTALLRAELARRDCAGDAVYLEVAKSRTEEFYRRFGFETVGAVRLAEDLELRGMWRAPGG